MRSPKCSNACQLLPRLRPVVAQWDRLSVTWCYTLILAGPVKVDLIFTEPHAVLPAWQVTAATLRGIDDHFWDGMLWLAAKQRADKAGQAIGGYRPPAAAGNTC